MTTVQNSAAHPFTRPVRPYAPSHTQRKNSAMSVATTPILSSFAIDLIAQFDNYRVNMRESLQREVEENIHKAKVLKEAMKESSDRDAENMISAEEQEYNSSVPNNRSNSSLNKILGQASSQQGSNGDAGSQHNGKLGSPEKEKRSRLDRIFGRKTSVNSQASSLRNQVTPHPQPQSQVRPLSQSSSQHQTPSPSLRASNTLTAHANNSASHANSSTLDVNEIKYLPVEEESEEEEVRNRSMTVPGSGVGGLNGEATGTEVKLHPTRAKTFALPKSLRNLKRRIAALRAKGTDLDAERREKEERERAANGGVAVVEEKKKFAFIRLLPWKTTKKLEITSA
ncbi:hypothetical protein BX616_010526 [Lobosporangium transversale]|uniref:Uncharacterized protein n=1 Tax=Lobosporangium transversale TaxID=64571 RepID=A0A1Y2GBW2_9FUNG|nr:hypothetical protein BCR41DRAFT_362057 [Lobosporangium transversale]KAF9911690.1 hypothetical protein BX616_010526 [Lobosporangium transversale]ORZ05175.1 hypothetical protein BCR41DRAFT_362057 [Lobosporangium transversale]|eukprot:XP_021876950.1 hypothetical protein BCR41DRAFT_362057 [Lobosporangium transversale]